MRQKDERMSHPIRRILILAVTAGLLIVPRPAPAETVPRPVPAKTITLDGSRLGLSTIALVARDVSAAVAVDPAAFERVGAGFDIVMAAAAQGMPVYGLTVGVGWNKDRTVVFGATGAATLDEALLEASRRFNRMSLRAHGGGLPPELPIETVRAAMLIRLNTLLSGHPGAQPAVAQLYQAFLNAGITPVVPGRGSVGEADITLSSHIGLAMMGEWMVNYRGRRMRAADALAEAGIRPLVPVGKDFLAIASNNALSAARAVLLANDVEAYLTRSTLVFTLSLQGLDGNVAPFLAETADLRPFGGMREAARRIRAALTGSQLWQGSDKRALQDPLSFRNMAYTLGETVEALDDLKAALAIQINHSDDNPAVVVGRWPADGSGGSQVERYRLTRDPQGAILPTANFEMLPVAVRLERVSLALARLSQATVMRIIRFENPETTHLSRFLAAPDNGGHAFGAMQKPAVALLVENRQLAMPVSLDTAPMAGGIEDTPSNAMHAANNLARILDNMYLLSSIELLHAAQAIDLRGTIVSPASKALLDSYRSRVPFVSEDRIYTPDFATGVEILRRFPAHLTSVD
jgi:histidine ammonia-lyase